MARADFIKSPFESCQNRDDAGFRAATEEIVVEERKKHHPVLANELQRILANGPRRRFGCDPFGPLNLHNPLSIEIRAPGTKMTMIEASRSSIRWVRATVPALVLVFAGGACGGDPPNSQSPARSAESKTALAEPSEVEAGLQEPERRDYLAEVQRALAQERGFGSLAPTEIARIKAATVLVLTSEATGTGFVFDRVGRNHLILTNHHVVGSPHADALPRLRVVLDSGSGAELVENAELVAFDRELDLALLSVSGFSGNLPTLSLAADPQLLVETQPILAVGFPFGPALGGGRFPSPTFARGTISSLRHGPDGELAAIQLDADLNPGNSGGPVLNSAGEVIGVAASGIDTTDISFVIPSTKVQHLLGGGVRSVKAQVIKVSDRTLASFVFDLADPLGRVAKVGIDRLRPNRPYDLRSSNVASFPTETLGAVRPAGTKASITVPLPPEERFETASVLLQAWFETKDKRVDLGPFELTTRAAAGSLVVYPQGRERAHPAVALNPGAGAKSWNLSSNVSSGWGEKVRPPRTELEVPLPGQLKDLKVSGGGRFLILRMENNSLGLFDLVSLKLEHVFPTVNDELLFASGGQTLVVYYPQLRLFHVFDLETRERSLSLPADLPGSITLLAMGRSNSRAALVGWKQELRNRIQWALFDTRTGRLDSLYDEGCQDQQRPHYQREGTAVDAAPDLRRFLAWGGGGVSNMAIYDIDGGELRCTIGDSGSSSHCALSDSGHVFCAGYPESSVRSADLRVLERYGYNNALFADPSGSVYLRVERDLTSGSITSFIHSTSSREPLFPYAVPSRWLPERLHGPPGPLPLHRRILLLPHAGLVVAFPVDRSLMSIRPFDLKTQLEGSQGSFLVIVSHPRYRAIRGSQYTYDIQATSGSSRLTYVLESGPDDMTVDLQGRIRWEVPVNLAANPQVIVKVLDGDGNSQYQSWRIRID